MENLTYFANGAACMLFMLASLHFRRKPQNKTFNLVLYYVLLFWAILFWKDILLMLPAIRQSEYAETLLMSIDMWAVAACAFYLMALLRPLALTRKFVISNLLPYILFTVLYYYRKLSNFCRQYRICHNVRDCSPFLLCQRDKTI